jgi:hypothetical protein
MFPLTNFRRLAVSLAMFAVVALGSSAAAKANPVNFVLAGPDFSGSNAVAGSLTVNIVNSGSGTVTFTITNNTDGFIDSIYLNNTVLTALPTLNCTGCSAVGSMNVSFGSNAFKADGDGKYDLLLEFPTGNADNRFESGESIMFTLTATNLDSDSFVDFSEPAGGNGPFRIAAHVQNTTSSGGLSVWITESSVPEPTSMVLLGTGLIGIATGIRKRFRK